MNKAALYALVSIIALTAGAGASWLRYKHRPEAQQGAAMPTAAPASLWQASFKDIAGQPQALAQWRGKPVVVNFWATWCGPCREEMPDFEAASKAFGDKAHIVGIAIDNAESVKKFTAELGVDYPIVVGEQDALDLMHAQGNTIGALPFTVIYDRTGKKVAAHAGRLSREKLDAYLKPLI